MPGMIPRHGAGASAPVHKAKRDYGKNDPRSSRPWRRLRQQVLLRDKYTCQGVNNGKKCGKISTHMEVDHIKPRNQGGTDELGNLQTLCPLCHLMKTSGEAATRPASMAPDWMPSTTKPLVLVCGRPASGKSEYVKQNAKPGELVVDLELMAAEIGCELWDLSKEQTFALIRLRNNRIANFARGQTEHPKAWIVTAAGRDYLRQFWSDRGAEVVVIDTPLEVCQRRIVAQSQPGERTDKRLQLAQDWK